MTSRVLFAVTILIGLAVTGAYLGSEKDLIKTANSAPIVFCRPNNMVSALAYIAEIKNFFKEEQLNVQFPLATNAKICQDLMLSGKADFMNGADGPFTYIAAGKPAIKIIAFLQRNPETSVFARRDRGIHSFADLKGKRVAYLPGTVSYFFLARLLDSLQLTKADLLLVSMQPPTMTQALVGGSIDAFIMWEPWGSNALEQLGDNGIRLADTALYQYEDLLTASTKVLSERPEAAHQVLRALLKAESFLIHNQEESVALLSQAISFKHEILKKNWNEYFNRVRIERAPIDLMYKNFSLLRRGDQNFSHVETPHFESFVDDSFLKAIAADRVISFEK